MLNTVLASDIRHTLDHFRRSVDQFFDNTNGYSAERTPNQSTETPQWTFSPAVESGWDKNALHIRAIVPGVAESDLTVNLQGNQLVISGERKAPEGWLRNGYSQLTYGKFFTSVTLPNGLDLDKVSCRLHDGVLDVEIPMLESMRPRQIPIAGTGQKAINS